MIHFILEELLFILLYFIHKHLKKVPINTLFGSGEMTSSITVKSMLTVSLQEVRPPGGANKVQSLAQGTLTYGQGDPGDRTTNVMNQKTKKATINE